MGAAARDQVIWGWNARSRRPGLLWIGVRQAGTAVRPARSKTQSRTCRRASPQPCFEPRLLVHQAVRSQDTTNSHCPKAAPLSSRVASPIDTSDTAASNSQIARVLAMTEDRPKRQTRNLSNPAAQLDTATWMHMRGRWAAGEPRTSCDRTVLNAGIRSVSEVDEPRLPYSARSLGSSMNSMVRAKGLEPPRAIAHQDLNLRRFVPTSPNESRNRAVLGEAERLSSHLVPSCPNASRF